MLYFGGLCSFRAALTFYLGLILRDYVVSAHGSLYGFLTGPQMSLALPHDHLVHRWCGERRRDLFRFSGWYAGSTGDGAALSVRAYLLMRSSGSVGTGR